MVDARFCDLKLSDDGIEPAVGSENPGSQHYATLIIHNLPGRRDWNGISAHPLSLRAWRNKALQADGSRRSPDLRIDAQGALLARHASVADLLTNV